MKIKMLLILMALTAIVVFGCETIKESDESITSESITSGGTEETAKTANVGIRINFNSKAGSRLMTALGTVDEITRVTVEAKVVEDIIGNSELILVDGFWDGAMEEMPYDTEILFTANALNSVGTVIYSGTLTKTMVAGQNNDITIQMLSIDDGLQPTLPTIVSASLPAKVLVNSAPVKISFQIDHTANVAYTLEASGAKVAATAGGTPVITIEGIHDPSADLEAYFVAPSAVGVASLKLTVRDLEQQDTVGAIYTINVVAFDPATWTDSGVSIVFGPAITAMSFVRSETNLKMTVSTDPDSGLTYAWTGTGSFVDLNQTGNPIFITGFSDTMTGDIEVTVTDAEGLQAFIIRTVNAGDYPYTGEDFILDMPGVYLYDETTALLWQDNSNLIERTWVNAGTYCQDLTLVGYSVWRLPTVNELTSMFDRKGELSYYDPDQYWSSEIDPEDSRNAKLVSYEDNSIVSDRTNKSHLVRCVKE